MKARWADKYRGAGHALAVLAIAAAAGMAGFKPAPRFTAAAPARGAAPDDAEARRAEKAIADLRRLAEMERAQAPARGTGSDGVFALHSPELAASSMQSTVSVTDFSKSSVVILGTQRGTFAVVDGVAVRAGQRLPSGELVRSLGRTFMLIEDGAGAVRRVDINDGFGGAVPSSPARPTAVATPARPSPRVGAAVTAPGAPAATTASAPSSRLDGSATPASTPAAASSSPPSVPTP
jgi:hypothetical protein